MLGKDKRTIINIVCSLLVLFTNLIINFFLSPYIVSHIGVEANGFVTLANNCVTYATLIVAALNSMAARFITISYVNKDYRKANLYYNSVFWGNLIIVAVLFLPAVYLILRLDRLVDIPKGIVLDVKFLFSLVFLNFFVTTGLPNWDCGAFVTNRLDRNYIPEVATSILRCVILFAMLSVFTPHVWYVGFSASVMIFLRLAAKGYNTHQLTPHLRISHDNGKPICSLSAIKELVGSGIWDATATAGNMLLTGIDLIICNIYLGSAAMGIVSLAKMLPNLIQHLSDSIRGAFVPELTINYAKGDKEAVLRDLSRAMKITSFIVTIPIGGIVVMGDRFFSLWVPSQDAKLLQVLTILAIFGFIFISGIQILYNVFPVVNKVKENAISTIVSGICSFIITVLLIKYTNLGIYAVAGVSTIVILVRNLVFTLPAAAHYLGFKWYQFFSQMGLTVMASVIIIIVGIIVKSFIPSGGWILFFVTSCIIGLLGAAVNFYIILNKNERAFLADKLKSRLKKQ